MGFAEHLIEEIVAFFNHEKEVYTELLAKSPVGSLHHDKSGKEGRYLHSVPCGKDASGTRHYDRKTITQEKKDLLAGLAVKEYAKSALKIIERNLRVLEGVQRQLLEFTDESIAAGMRSLYRQLPEECFRTVQRAGLITLRQHAWAEEPYEQSSYRPEEKKHTTSRGLKVRSRAELLIAEMLYRYDIPFRYEQVMIIGGYDLAPDFTFLDMDGKEFY